MTDLADGTEVLVTWLAPLADCRSERPAGAALPFISVRRGGGGDDGLTDIGRYSIHVFHNTEAQAAEFAATVRRRLRLLAGRFTGPQAVTLPDGDVHVDHMRVIEGFRPEDYAAEPDVERVRAVIELYLRVS